MNCNAARSVSHTGGTVGVICQGGVYHIKPANQMREIWPCRWKSAGV